VWTIAHRLTFRYQPPDIPGAVFGEGVEEPQDPNDPGWSPHCPPIPQEPINYPVTVFKDPQGRSWLSPRELAQALGLKTLASSLTRYPRPGEVVKVLADVSKTLGLSARPNLLVSPAGFERILAHVWPSGESFRFKKWWAAVNAHGGLTPEAADKAALELAGGPDSIVLPDWLNDDAE
jgi:hypothetical protein